MSKYAQRIKEIKYIYIAHSGREGAEGSTVGIRSTSRDRETIVGRCLEFSGRTSAMFARVCGGTRSPLRAVSRRHAGSTTRACRVSYLIRHLVSFCLAKRVLLSIPRYHCPRTVCVIATFLVQLSYLMVIRVSNV